MDFRVEAVDARCWIELRSALPLEDGDTFQTLLRVGIGGRTHRRLFYFARDDLRAFLADADARTTHAPHVATLGSSGTPDFFSLQRAGHEWLLGGELFHFQDAEQHLRFSFPISPAARVHLLSSLEAMAHARVPDVPANLRLRDALLQRCTGDSF